MIALSGVDVLAGKAPKDVPVTVKGWVRTRRDSKAGISFVHVSDGSCFHPVQVLAPSALPNWPPCGRVKALTRWSTSSPLSRGANAAS